MFGNRTHFHKTKQLIFLWILTLSTEEWLQSNLYNAGS